MVEMGRGFREQEVIQSEGRGKGSDRRADG